jgi:hypothetical protein
MPMHDWTCVSAGTFHAFHNAWITHLQEALNAGRLPPEYYALGEQRAEDVSPDLLTLHAEDEGSDENGGGTGHTVGMVAVAESPPAVRIHLEAEPDLAFSVATLATALAQNQAMASVPPALLASTVQSTSLIASGSAAADVVSAYVAAIAEGVIRAMFLTKLKTVASLVLAVGILASGAGFVTHQALAQKPGKPAVQDGKKSEAEFTGVVRAVDTAGQTITIGGKLISSGGKLTTEKAFPLASDAKVFFDNGTGDESAAAVGKLADLTEGTNVTIRLGGNQKVTSIRAEGPTVQAIVDSVNAAAHSIQVTIRPGKGDPEQKTLAVAPNARVTIADGKIGKTKDKSPPPASSLADLPTGSHVTLKLSADRQTVGSIVAEGPTIRGTVKTVDPASGTITLAVQEGKQSVDKSFNVKNASVTIADAIGKTDKGKATEQRLADLPVGALATLRLSPSQEVISVSAEGPSISGILKQVDATAKRLTLVKTAKGEADRELEFAIAGEVHVTIDGSGDRPLGDLPTGVSVTVRLSADQKLVHAIDAEGPSIQGNATIVDLTSRRITINEKVAENIYQVTTDTQIAVDGKSSELGSVPVGAVIRAKLTADRSTIRSLSADGPSVRGKLVGVDTANRSVTVHVAKQGDIVFDITVDARVATEVYGVSLKLADLQLEREVSLMLTADRKKVSRITVHGE